MVQDYVMKVVGIRVVGNSLRPRLIIKNEREVSKQFPWNNDLAKDYPDALADMANYLNTDAKYWLAVEVEYKNKSLIVRGVDFELVKEMLAGTPVGVYTSMCVDMRYKRFIVGQNTKNHIMQQNNSKLCTIFCSLFIAIMSVESWPGK